MARSWEEVTNLPEYQSLSDEQKEEARDQYFYDNVAPNANTMDEIRVMREQFDADTAPPPPPEDTWGETLTKAVKRAGTRMKSSVGGLMQDYEQKDQQVVAGAQRAAEGKPFATLDLIKLGVNAPRMIAEALDPKARAGMQDIRGQVGEAGRGIADQAHEELQGMEYYNEDGSLKYYVGHGTEVLFGNVLPALGIGLVTRSPNTGLAFMGGQVYGEKYQDAIREGRSPEQASMDAAFYALSETITERIPLGMALKHGEKFLRRVLKTSGAEGVSEVINSIMQRAYDEGMVNEETDLKSFIQALSSEEAFKEYRDALVIGMGVGGTMATVAHPAVRSQEKSDVEIMKNTTPDQLAAMDNAMLEQYIDNGARMANTYGDQDLAQTVEVFKAELDARNEAQGLAARDWSGPASWKKPQGPLERAVEKAEAGAITPADEIQTDEETGLADEPQGVERRETAREGVAPVGAVKTEEEEQQPSYPEPLANIEAQLAEMANPESPKDTVFVAEGTQLPESVPEGAQVVEGRTGTLITTNPQKAKLFQKDEAEVPRLLGYARSKEEIAQTVDETGEQPMVAVVRNDEGVPIHEEVIAPGQEQPATLRLQQEYGRPVEIVDPMDVIAERTERIEAEQQRQAEEQEQAETEEQLEEAGEQITDEMPAELPEGVEPILKSDGQPFPTEQQARQAMINRELPEADNSIIPYEGGFAIAQMTTEQPPAEKPAKKKFVPVTLKFATENALLAGDPSNLAEFNQLSEELGVDPWSKRSNIIALRNQAEQRKAELEKKKAATPEPKKVPKKAKKPEHGAVKTEDMTDEQIINLPLEEFEELVLATNRRLSQADKDLKDKKTTFEEVEKAEAEFVRLNNLWRTHGALKKTARDLDDFKAKEKERQRKAREKAKPKDKPYTDTTKIFETFYQEEHKTEYGPVIATASWAYRPEKYKDTYGTDGALINVGVTRKDTNKGKSFSGLVYQGPTDNASIDKFIDMVVQNNADEIFPEEAKAKKAEQRKAERKAKKEAEKTAPESAPPRMTELGEPAPEIGDRVTVNYNPADTSIEGLTGEVTEVSLYPTPSTVKIKFDDARINRKTADQVFPIMYLDESGLQRKAQDQPAIPEQEQPALEAPAPGINMRDINIRLEVPGAEDMVVNADTAYNMAEARLDELAALRDCVRS